MTANEYPITTPYGYVAGYPLHNGFHQGIDFGCPVGTFVVVNGVTVGLSGNTGYTFGSHLHLGKWLNGVVQNPLNGGFHFTSAVVTEVDTVGATDNGKFVRIQGDGASWVYLHLSSIKVKVGQILPQGGGMPYISDEEYQDLKNWKKAFQPVAFSAAWIKAGGTPGTPVPDVSGTFNVITADDAKYADWVKADPDWQASGADLTKLDIVPKGTASNPTVLAKGDYRVQ